MSEGILKTRDEWRRQVELMERHMEWVGGLGLLRELERLWLVEDTVRDEWRRRGGRPKLGGKRLTNAERCRRYREKKRRELEREARDAAQGGAIASGGRVVGLRFPNTGG